jgi:putative sigma-54 modulation protein
VDGVTAQTAVAEPPDEDLDDDIEGAIVRIKRFSMKPMPPEEAIEQMELLGHNFFLFHNTEEEQLNVLYRRRDGSYGILAPERS